MLVEDMSMKDAQAHLDTGGYFSVQGAPVTVRSLSDEPGVYVLVSRVAEQTSPAARSSFGGILEMMEQVTPLSNWTAV